MEKSAKCLIAQIEEELRTGKVLGRSFPQVFSPGLLSGEVHPTFVTYLAVLGHQCGFHAVAELPVSNRSKQLFHNKSGTNIREPDSVWLRTGDLKSVLFAEYEGIEDEIGFESKLQSLIEAFNDAEEKPYVLLMCWWRKHGKMTRMQFSRAQRMYKSGFAHPNTGVLVPPPSVPLIIWEACFRRERDRWIFTRFAHTGTWQI